MRPSVRPDSTRAVRLCAACIVWCALLTPSALAGDIYRCINVLDGDSIIIQIGEFLAPVRLLGIDCPEKNQEWGDAAKAFTTARIQGKDVRLEFDTPYHDKYSRNLCYVWYKENGGWTCLNVALIRAGLAVPFRSRSNIRLQPKILAAQQQAREARAGFWANGGLSLSPHDFRRRN
ncbi:thermonuclease family protein [Oceanidesulfovibrio marinus]|uniref:Nuclease n=1 Tax=Oceanidesulfovibrio marinus TaxID=370038 RepID=A0ABX6NE68_9BACT|nr:thermonuclease family protein [Oceanidesulfovibrio marinus]QJT08898.1 nuclease [Oceanidesulfovibrio marinus]